MMKKVGVVSCLFFGGCGTCFEMLEKSLKIVLAESELFTSLSAVNHEGERQQKLNFEFKVEFNSLKNWSLRWFSFLRFSS